jgi:hypothetical protein
MPNFPPRCWIDWKVPLDEGGQELGVVNGDAERYQQYLHWLADYLYETPIPVPERQRDVVERYQESGGASSAIFDIAASLGYELSALEACEDEINRGVSWEEFHDNEMQYWEGLSGAEREGFTKEDVVMTRAEFERVSVEVEESKSIPRHIGHADIPFRAIFAIFFKEIEDHQERYRLLKQFYQEFYECASK